MFLCNFSLLRFYQCYAINIYLFASRRNSKKFPRVVTLEIPVFYNFITFSKNIDNCEFDIRKSSYIVLIVILETLNPNYIFW